MLNFIDWWVEYVLMPITILIASLLAIGMVFLLAYGVVELFQSV